MGNAASEYCEPKEGEVYARVRRDASYLYEDFMHTGGTDVKARRHHTHVTFDSLLTPPLRAPTHSRHRSPRAVRE